MSLSTNETLYVISPCFNPCRYSSRYRLFKDFQKYVNCTEQAKLFTVEIAFGDREFQVTESNNPFNLQLRTKSELFLKENAINLAVQRLPSDWKYMAWVDADIMFSRPDWARETMEQLQHSPIVQMFSKVQDLGPDNTPFQNCVGFAYGYRNNIPKGSTISDRNEYGYQYHHCGFSWACTRQAFDDIGGLLDFCILGSADYSMAMAFIGQAEKSMPKNINFEYQESVMIFQERCNKYIRGNIGYIDALCSHRFHGKKKDRKYKERWKILIDNEYSPEHDIKRDSNGLWQLTDNKPELKKAAYDYFKYRNEDSIDLK